MLSPHSFFLSLSRCLFPLSSRRAFLPQPRAAPMQERRPLTHLPFILTSYPLSFCPFLKRMKNSFTIFPSTHPSFTSPHTNHIPRFCPCRVVRIRYCKISPYVHRLHYFSPCPSSQRRVPLAYQETSSFAPPIFRRRFASHVSRLLTYSLFPCSFFL